MQYNAAMFAAAPLLTLFDRLLDTQPAARARLAGHAGKSARIALPLADIRFGLGEGGRLEPSATETPDTSILLTPDILFRLALGDKAALRQARIDGDGLLASDLSAALDGFDWALALRPVLGDMAAARADQALTGLSDWRRRAHDALGQTLAEYSVHEAGLLASRQSLDSFSAQVDTLRDDAARLEARLALLEQRKA